MRLGLPLALIALAVVSVIAFNIYSGHPLAIPGVPTTTSAKTNGEVDTPGPLRSSSQIAAGTLTRAGIIEQTNAQRTKEGLANLTMNTTLNQAAEKKVADMFTQQYFEHISPKGIGPAELAQSVGYQYIRIGENLAEGGFKDDQDVVTAWMNSPGHRANILRPNVTEIGVAAAQGTFEGKKVWMAVQEFGLPASTCPSPDPKPQKAFDALQTTVIAQGKILAAEKATLDQQQKDLNTLAATIDQLAKDGNAEIAQGNAEMAAGNQASQNGDQETAQADWTKGEQLQADGKSKLDDAQTKQTDWSAQNATFQTTETSYNQKVDAYQQLQGQLKALEKPINAAIAVYNACITK